MRTNQEGIKIIKDSESLQLKAYRCPAGILTIGYGHTRNVTEGMITTKEKAEVLLVEDIEIAESQVNKYIKTQLTDNQFSAVTSIVFNCKIEQLKDSTLFRKLNNKDYAGAAAEFSRWVYAKGKMLPGLVLRRKKETDLFLKP